MSGEYARRGLRGLGLAAAGLATVGLAAVAAAVQRILAQQAQRRPIHQKCNDLPWIDCSENRWGEDFQVLSDLLLTQECCGRIENQRQLYGFGTKVFCTLLQRPFHNRESRFVLGRRQGLWLCVVSLLWVFLVEWV